MERETSTRRGAREDMNQSQRMSPAPLDKVLDAFAEAGPSKKTLKAFVERYPEHRSELVDFAAHWGVQQRLPEGEEPDVEELVRRGHEIAMQYFDDPTDHGYEEDTDPGNPDSEDGADAAQAGGGLGERAFGRDMPASFEALLKEVGLDFGRFSDVSGLGFSTLANLNTSRLTFTDDEERRRVAHLLASDIEKATDVNAPPRPQLASAVEQTLAQPPRQTAGAHRAEKTPKTSVQNFFKAIQEDREMSEEAKRRWLRLQAD